VGAAQESDQEILTTVMSLYKDYRVKRSYFSAFQPVPQTPLENLKPVPLKRENRLYQAEFLFRLYKFTLDDLVFDPTGNLDLTLDPKLMFAVKNPQLFPMEINRASFYDLLRVPGIGPKSARRLLVVRRRHRFTSLEELKNVGVVIKRASPFITINGKKQGDLNWLYNPQPQKFTQLSFW
jgi:predicted DNA-binding helix-hairpin-helix protein